MTLSFLSQAGQTIGNEILFLSAYENVKIVEQDSQKGIVVGQGGETIKRIGVEACDNLGIFSASIVQQIAQLIAQFNR